MYVLVLEAGFIAKRQSLSSKVSAEVKLMCVPMIMLLGLYNSCSLEPALVRHQSLN